MFDRTALFLGDSLLAQSDIIVPLLRAFRHGWLLPLGEPSPGLLDKSLCADLRPELIVLVDSRPYAEQYELAQAWRDAHGLAVLLIHEKVENGYLADRIASCHPSALKLNSYDILRDLLPEGQEPTDVSETLVGSAADGVYTSDHLPRLFGLSVDAVKTAIQDGSLSAHPIAQARNWELSGEAATRSLGAKFREEQDEAEAPKRILIVDDEHSIVGLISSAIQFAGYNVVTDSAGNGYEAMLKIGSSRPDLVILDVQMPGADGRKVLQAIRGNVHTSTTRILAVSAHPDAIQEMSNRGADDALIKPFDLKTLLNKLEILLPSINKRGRK